MVLLLLPPRYDYIQQDEALLGLVERLLEVAKLDSNPTASRHSALYGIQLLTMRIGNRHSSVFLKVTDIEANTYLCCSVNNLGVDSDFIFSNRADVTSTVPVYQMLHAL